MCDECLAILHECKTFCEKNGFRQSDTYPRVVDAIVAHEQRRLGLGEALRDVFEGGEDTDDYQEPKE